MIKFSQLQKNIISGSLVHALNIGLVFISYPIYITLLGLEQFSVWSLISIIITFAQFGDFGIGKAIVNYSSSLFNSNKRDEIPALITNGLTVVFAISFLIQITIHLFLNKIISILNIPAVYYYDAQKAIPLIGISIFTFLLYDCFANVIAGIGRIDIYNLFLLLLNILKTTLTVIFLMIKPNFLSMVYGILFSNIIFLILVLIWLKKNNIVKFLNLNAINKNKIIELIKFGSSIFGIQFVNIIMFPFIKVIISKLFGINYVGYFELATKSAYSFRTLFEKGLSALFPEFSKFSDTDRISIAKLKKIVKKITFSTLLYIIPFFILIIIFSKLFLKIWLQSNYNENIYIGFVLLQPGIIVSLLSLPSYYALMGLRKQKHCFFESLIRLILTLIIFIAFKFILINYFMVFLIISIIVIISNSYILFVFKNVK